MRARPTIGPTMAPAIHALLELFSSLLGSGAMSVGVELLVGVEEAAVIEGTAAMDGSPVIWCQYRHLRV